VRSVRGSAQRFYAELVRRRSRVRITQADEVNTTGAPPIFILGLFRSGTTAVRYVLDSHSHIACPAETEFLEHSAALLRDERAMAGLASAGFDRDHVVARSRDFASYFYANYAQGRGKARWADKTPAYVEILDEIDEIFPDARYVVIHRHPLDQVHSFTGGGTHLPPQLEPYVVGDESPIESAGRYWAINTARLHEFSIAHGSRVSAMRYEDMVTEPEEVFKKVFGDLDEPWEPQTLNYWDFTHDVGWEGGSALSYRSFEPSTGGFKKWNPALVDAVLTTTAESRKPLGYTDTPFSSDFR